MKQMNRYSGWIALLLAGWVSMVSAAERDPMVHFFNQGFDDLKEELSAARQEGKKALLVMFDNADCPWCAKMKATVINQQDVQEYFRQHFRITRIDTEGDAPVIDFDGAELLQKDFAFKHNRVRATPVFQFYDLTGKKIARYTGATRDKEEFMWLGEWVAEGHYRQGPFAKYKRNKLKAARDKR